MTLKNGHARPSLGYDGGYTQVHECMQCQRVEQISDVKLPSICNRCGYKGFFNYPARWVSTSKFWNPYSWNTGQWEKPPEKATEVDSDVR